MPKDMKEKKKELAKISLGSGLAENAKNKLANRQADLDARIAAATGSSSPKKKNK
jgi:hypothetical protein